MLHRCAPAVMLDKDEQIRSIPLQQITKFKLKFKIV